MDSFYDPSAGYLRWVLGNAAFHHETRSSAWYAVGLLARNGRGDVKEAEKIIGRVVGGQFKDPKDQWFVFPVSFSFGMRSGVRTGMGTGRA